MANITVQKTNDPLSPVCFNSCNNGHNPDVRESQTILQGGDELTCGVMAGVCFPCCFWPCYTQHVPGYYSMTIPSKSTRTEIVKFEGREGSPTTYKDYQLHTRIKVMALKEDADRVMDLLKAGIAGNFAAFPGNDLDKSQRDAMASFSREL